MQWFRITGWPKNPYPQHPWGVLTKKVKQRMHNTQWRYGYVNTIHIQIYHFVTKKRNADVFVFRVPSHKWSVARLQEISRHVGDNYRWIGKEKPKQNCSVITIRPITNWLGPTGLNEAHSKSFGDFKNALRIIAFQITPAVGFLIWFSSASKYTSGWCMSQSAAPRW